MTQNASDVEIANQGFAAFRQDLNDVLEDITTLHSGTAAPSTTYANQWWYETDTDKLYIRNEDNDAWIEILTLDQANDHLASLGASITLDGTGNVSIDSGDFTVDTSTLHVDSTNNRVGVGTTSPSQPLSVVTSSGAAYLYSDNGTANTYIGSDGSNTALFGTSTNHDTRFMSNNTERMRITSSGNVGIGTDLPATLIEAKDTTPTLRLTDDRNITWSGNEELGKVEFYNSDTSGSGAHVTGFIKNIQSITGGSTQVQGDLTFGTAAYGVAATEAMRIDSSGNLLVGTTDTTPYNNTSGGGFVVHSSGLTSIARETTSSAQTVLHLNNTGVDGIIAEFAKDASTVGKIGNSSSDLFIASGSGAGLLLNGSNVLPANGSGTAVNNDRDLGSSSYRWRDIYTNGAVNTSDQNEKQQIAALTTAEIAAAKRISTLFKTFKWNDAVASKGDNARIHAGVIAQDVEAALIAEGLDAADYAFGVWILGGKRRPKCQPLKPWKRKMRFMTKTAIL